MPIVFDRCTFAYRRRRYVIDRLDLAFPRGRTVLLGPNGAGKSTLLALAASALRPDEGTVSHESTRTTAKRAQLAAYRRNVAWMPQELSVVPGLTAREQVAYAGWLKGLNRRTAWENALGALRQVELGNRANEKVSALSGGQQRRVGVAQALVHEARVLLLDEPTAGMDPRQRTVFHEALAGLPPSVHVILSTHDTADLEAVYDQVVVVNEGRVAFQGPVRAFLGHADPAAVPGRKADSAYHALTGGSRTWDS
ncbi:ATP-binding cassette domain-containing protein [Streptomyces albidoflavus]|uniref:ATP-binding cassette domain-containing protein n=1 Tax=Streptomyces koyangensis TaxID=188770 RepID=A0A385DBT4_9ACTN|nr:ATP-binding cassette domain-containing protein [Streptomyces koyangensis]AXQ55450.1 ATP-binding cassette domain-containing protein [Streptomyces koyangensis]MBZ2408236.1 ATP-binding cassette domain-containing protein [Streptomyces sp. L06]WTD04620.1 ATP-binding cassette domain-containing protein [Streptomyces albidoflavus]